MVKFILIAKYKYTISNREIFPRKGNINNNDNIHDENILKWKPQQDWETLLQMKTKNNSR